MSLLVAVAASSGLALLWSGVTLPRRRRLASRVEPFLSGLQGKPSTLLHRSTTTKGPWRELERALRRFLPYRYDELEARLASAGDDRRPEEFRVEQLLWALSVSVSVVTVFTLAAASGVGVDVRAIPLLAVVTAVSGFFARDWWLGHEIAVRRAVISSELPVALDLVALAVMAGESVPAAFERVAGRLGDGIGAEFRKVVADIRAGAPMVEAIEGLSGRVIDPSLARFVDAICTGIERGSPLSDVLRGQADDARDARRRHLLELGGKKEVLMLVPVVFLIMPVVVVLALYPGLVSLELLVP